MQSYFSFFSTLFSRFRTNHSLPSVCLHLRPFSPQLILCSIIPSVCLPSPLYFHFLLFPQVLTIHSLTRIYLPWICTHSTVSIYPSSSSFKGVFPAVVYAPFLPGTSLYCLLYILLPWCNILKVNRTQLCLAFLSHVFTFFFTKIVHTVLRWVVSVGFSFSLHTYIYTYITEQPLSATHIDSYGL